MTELIEKATTVGEENPQQKYDTAMEAAANGGPKRRYATAEELLSNAPKDIIEEDIEDVFSGLTVRVRSLTAAQSAEVKQRSFSVGSGRQMDLAWSQMEIYQFELGVIEPKLSHDQVLMLHRMSGPSFAKVINKLDEISGIGKEELREAQRDFQKL